MKNFLNNIIREGLVPYMETISEINLFSLDKIALKFKNYGDGFLYYRELRYSIYDNTICEYNIDFYGKPKTKYSCNVSDLGKVTISNELFMHEFIRVLKYENIDFDVIKIKDKDYFILQTESKVNIYFDLEEGKLYRIGKLIYDYFDR